MSVAAAIISGVAALGSAIASGVSAKRQAERANQFALEQRDYQNIYNSPEAQMQRFAQAGLNPNLIYGQVKNHASEQADYQTANYDNMLNQMANVMPTMLSILKQSSDLRLQEQEIRNKELSNTMKDLDLTQYGEKIKTELEFLKKNTQFRGKELDFYDTAREREKQMLDSTIALQSSQTTLADWNAKRVEQDYNYYNNPTQSISRNLGGIETLLINFLSKYLPDLKKKADEAEEKIRNFDFNPFN